MKASESPEELFNMITTCLKAAEQAAVWSFWRERFGTNHPDHNRKEIDSPKQFATANFFAAKALYCANKEAIDTYYASFFGGETLRYPTTPEKCELYIAMRRVVDKEMEDEMENVLDQPDLESTELDEDEEYVRATSNDDGPDIWDGDEYLGEHDDMDLDRDGFSYDK